MFEFPDATLVVFSKAPVPGEVKTRLIPVLGAEQAAELQQLMTENIIQSFSHAKLCPVQLWCSPDAKHAFFQQLARQYNVTLHQQQGGNLGEKMYFSLRQALSSYRIAIIVGCDCLQVNADHIREVIDILSSGRNTVIIPATDGGYVLMGLTSVDSRLFDGIQWGVSSVMDATRERLNQLKWKYHELTAQLDIDDVDDLRQLLNTSGQHSLSEPLQRVLQTLRPIISR